MSDLQVLDRTPEVPRAKPAISVESAVLAATPAPAVAKAKRSGGLLGLLDAGKIDAVERSMSLPSALNRKLQTQESYGQAEPFNAGLCRAHKTRLVCTLGPSTASPDMVDDLVASGMDGVRLNLSHGTLAWHKRMVAAVRASSTKFGRPVSVMVEIKGLECRTGPIGKTTADVGDGIELRQGQEYTFSTAYCVGTNTRCSLTQWGFNKMVEVGARIFFDYGRVSFKVVALRNKDIVCEVENAGVLLPGKVVHVVGTSLNAYAADVPFLNYDDTKEIAEMLDAGIEFLMLPFVRSGADVREVRELPGVAESGVKIVSKLACEAAVQNIESIIDESDGVVLGRSDAMLLMPLEKLPTFQKWVIARANKKCKLTIVMHQVLHTMAVNPRPTRAECTDVFNIVSDGADAVVLTNTTANGKYALPTVRMLTQIFTEVEPSVPYRTLYRRIRKEDKRLPLISPVPSLASSAVKTAWDIDATLIVALCTGAQSVDWLAHYRSHAPIVMLTRDAKFAQAVAIVKNVVPIVVDDLKPSDFKQTHRHAMSIALERHFVRVGERVVYVYSENGDTDGVANVFRVATVDAPKDEK